MILIEGSWWPLVVVGQVADHELPPADAVVIDEECLEWGHDLRVALVVAGAGDVAARAQREMARWLQRFDTVLSRRATRLAWVIEDDAFRSAVDTWMAFTPRPAMHVPAATFRTMAAAIEWLAGPGLNSRWARPSPLAQ